MRSSLVAAASAVCAFSFAAAAESTVSLALHISTSGSRVLVDGSEVARDAQQMLEVPVKPGEHLVRVERDGFLPWEQKVVAQKTGLNLVDVLLQLTPPREAPPALAPAPPPDQTAIRVAVYELGAGQGIENRTARIVTEALVAEVRKLERLSAISMKEIQEMLSFEQQRQLLGCGDEACLAEIAGALGVDELVTGNLGVLGESHLITVKRIDMRAARVKGAVSRRLARADGEEFLVAVGPAVEEVFPDYPLREGRTRGVSREIAKRLNPPPLPRWAFFTTAGASLAALGAGGYFGLQLIDLKGQRTAVYERALATGSKVDGAELKRNADAQQQAVSRANWSLIAAGGLALAAVVEAFFTDWYAIGGVEMESATASVEPLPGGIRVAWRW